MSRIYWRALLSAKWDNRSFVVEACERAGVPYLLQVGDEIKPLKY